MEEHPIHKDLRSHVKAERLTLWFLRHAESCGNVLGDECPVMHDTPLSRAGVEEAERAALHLKDSGVSVTDVYSSPSERSMSTAQVAADAFGLSVKVKEALGERDWGAWKNEKWQEVSKRLAGMDFDTRRNFIPERGESWVMMEERLLGAISEIVSENTAGENILIVTHKGCLRAILPVLAKQARESHETFSVSTGAFAKFSVAKGVHDVGLTPAKK